MMPSKYDEKYPELLIEHMKQGFSFLAFGAVAMVSRATLNLWRKEHKEFEEAYQVGKNLSRREWESIGKEGLYEIVQKDKDGNINRLKMNSTVWLANMRNRFDWDKQDKSQASEEPIGINIDEQDAEL